MEKEMETGNGHKKWKGTWERGRKVRLKMEMGTGTGTGKGNGDGHEQMEWEGKWKREIERKMGKVKESEK
jgi:hypothetical protein